MQPQSDVTPLARRVRASARARICRDPRCRLCVGLPDAPPEPVRRVLPAPAPIVAPHARPVPLSREVLLAAREKVQPAASAAECWAAMAGVLGANMQTVRNRCRNLCIRAKLLPHVVERHAANRWPEAKIETLRQAVAATEPQATRWAAYALIAPVMGCSPRSVENACERYGLPVRVKKNGGN